MSWKNHLVAIFTPTGDGEGYWGTGIPVPNGHVLTARHVLHPEGASGEPVRICWWGSRDRKTEDDTQYRIFLDVPRDQIVWEDERFDVALLKCTPPEDIPGWLALDIRRPGSNMQWESEGFPRVAEIAEQQASASFRGGMTSARDDADYFELDVVSHPEEEHMWGGASGMPVISQDRQRILGICLEVPHGFNANRLHATPVWKLWEVEGFRKQLETPRDYAECEQKLKLQIKNALPPDKGWISEFASALGERGSAALSNSADAFVDFIVNGETSAEKILNSLHELHQNKPADSENIRKLASAIAPAIVGFLRVKGENADSSLFDGVVGQHTMAELAGAALDGRASDFRLRKHEYDYPKGRKWIPIAPEVGPNDSAEKLLAKWLLEDLENRVNPFGFKDAIAHYLLRNERVYEGSVQDLDDSIRNIARRLKRIFSATRFRYYLAVPTASFDQAQLAQLRSAIEEIKNVLPDLLIFELDYGLEADDEVNLANFPFMLPIEGGQQ